MWQQDLGSVVARMFTLETKDACETDPWESLSTREKNLVLFRRQKAMLDTFLSTGAISQAQHSKRLNRLIEKMGVKDDR